MQIDTSYIEYCQVLIYIAQCTITVASVRLTQAQYNYVYVAYKFTYCCTMTLSQLSGGSSSLSQTLQHTSKCVPRL